MPSFKVWDVVRVPFPYTNRPVRQHRPALVVALPHADREGFLLWVLMITSAGNRGWPSDVEISDLEIAGLPAPSLVRTAKIATIEAGDAEALGKLSKTDRLKVQKHLVGHLKGAHTST
ncbi:MAG: type II toxin-antitoxin system PemK/MazF family toxin [Alphaproteobacteria bacterium]|nr:type II toxin-antitoxin system PemK/MazF family toxin [Alphaproteobacteria bacterium]